MPRPQPRLVPFKAEHLLAFVKDRDSTWLGTVSVAIEREQDGIGYTGIAGNVILGCAGIVVPYPYVGFAWAVFPKEFEQHPIWMTRMVRNGLRDIIRVKNLHRVELAALADNKKNQKWAEMLGFSRENNATARQFTHDKRDVIRYEFIR